MPSAVEFARSQQPRFLEELKSLLRIPSISTLSEHAGDVRFAAQSLAGEMERIGLEHVRVIETSGHPLVYGDWLHATGKPTCLAYGHYDVQPADPLDEWHTPPFEPTERNGNLYARGAVDDKGQMFMHLKALESLFQSPAGAPPINVRIILEGEEEVGGEGIARFVREHPEQLRADFALVSDTEMFAPGLPTLVVGLRGMIYTELEAQGARTDLHSGIYGGAAPNPFVALAQVIAALKNPEGHILIPGFYDKVAAPSADEVKAWKSLPFDEEDYLEIRSRIKRACRRTGLFGAGTHLGSADHGCTRYAWRFHWRRRENRDSGESHREGLLPPGSRHEPAGGVRAVQELCRIITAEGR